MKYVIVLMLVLFAWQAWELRKTHRENERLELAVRYWAKIANDPNP